MGAIGLGHDERMDQLAFGLEKSSMHGFEIDEIAANVIRKEWATKVRQTEIRELLENHVQKINSIFGGRGYEVCVMRDFVTTAKGMSSTELKKYIKTIEALSYAYKSEFGSELAEALIIGIVAKAKNLENMQRFYKMYIDQYGERMRKLEEKSVRESVALESLVLKLRYNESSVFRFLRKKKILGIRRKISAKDKRIREISSKIDAKRRFLNNILEMIK